MKGAHTDVVPAWPHPAELASGFLDALFEQDEVGIALCDRKLRYVRVNSALATMNGCPAEDHIGRTIAEVLPQLGPELEQLFREVIETGAAAVGVELSGETPAQPHSERHWRASYYPLRDDAGAIIGVGALVIEVTDRRLAEAALERREREASYAAEVSAALSASLDAKRIMRRFARLLVPRVADWCVVDVVETDGSLRRAALAHADRSKEDLAWDLTRRYPGGPDAFEFTPKAIRSSYCELVPDISDSLLERIAQDERHLELLRGLGLRSLMIVPLTVRGRTLGAVGLVSAQSGRRYDRHDLALAHKLADRCALAVDNARLFEERAEVAETLAHSLLPPRLPRIDGVEIAARYRPGGGELAVGGDFYDVFALPCGGFAAAIGDVTGKGAAAAARTALARHTLHAAGVYEAHASGALRALNEALLGHDIERRSFLTAAFARFEQRPTGLDVEVAVGGHPPPWIVRRDGGVERAGAVGTLLGFGADPALTDCRYGLGPGDALVLYTDGVVEARPMERALGEDGLERLLSGCAGLDPEQIATRIEAAVGPEAHDDLALLIVRCCERPAASLS